ncbi:MAG: hypothetical protein ACREXR_23580 [Gammaproteobacteria bacterium]
MKTSIAIAAILVSTSAIAGGSFRVDSEFKPIKGQIPELWAALSSAFDMAESGGASMIGNNVNPRLGHARVGPYCLLAKPKGAPGPYKFDICFNTEPRWLDAEGRPTELPDAHSFTERFVSVEIEPWAEQP